MFRWIVLLQTIACAIAVQTSYDGYKVFRVEPKTTDQLVALKSLENWNGIDFWDPIHRTLDHAPRVMVAPETLANAVDFLNASAIQYHVIIDDLDSKFEMERNRNLRRSTNIEGKLDLTTFYTLEEIYTYLDELAAKFPDLVEIEVLGQSYEGRAIKAVKISLGGKVDDTRPNIILDGAIHAREWIGPMVILAFIDELCENSANNIGILTDIDWIIVPVANPDGYSYTHTNERLWRKTRKPSVNSECFGVDPNRNFHYQWDWSTVDYNPCSNTFRGPFPNSEIEVKTLSDLLTRYENTKLYLAIHSCGSYMLYPYGYDRVPVENAEAHDALGQKVTEAIAAVNGNNDYVVGNSAIVLYLASGASDDFAIARGKAQFSYTWELPCGGANGFDIEAERIEEVVNESIPGLKVFGQFVADEFVTK